MGYNIKYLCYLVYKKNEDNTLRRMHYNRWWRAELKLQNYPINKCHDIVKQCHSCHIDCEHHDSFRRLKYSLDRIKIEQTMVENRLLYYKFASRVTTHTKLIRKVRTALNVRLIYNGINMINSICKDIDGPKSYVVKDRSWIRYHHNIWVSENILLGGEHV